MKWNAASSFLGSEIALPALGGLEGRNPIVVIFVLTTDISYSTLHTGDLQEVFIQPAGTVDAAMGTGSGNTTFLGLFRGSENHF